MNPTLRTLSLALVSLLLVACGRKEPAPAAHSGGHVHTAPHGGMLIELGDHAYNLELLRDPASGKITVWVLDGHAENFVRIKAAAIEASVTVGGEKKSLALKAVANAATGETVGDTSQFEAQAEWLKGAASVELSVPSIEIKGRRFERLSGKVGVAAK